MVSLCHYKPVLITVSHPTTTGCLGHLYQVTHWQGLIPWITVGCLCRTLTIQPGHRQALKERHQHNNPAARIVVKQLEDVHPTLKHATNSTHNTLPFSSTGILVVALLEGLAVQLTYICDHGETHYARHNAHQQDEDFLPMSTSQMSRELVNEGCNKPLDSYKLQMATSKASVPVGTHHYTQGPSKPR